MPTGLVISSVLTAPSDIGYRLNETPMSALNGPDGRKLTLVEFHCGVCITNTQIRECFMDRVAHALPFSSLVVEIGLLARYVHCQRNPLTLQSSHQNP